MVHDPVWAWPNCLFVHRDHEVGRFDLPDRDHLSKNPNMATGTCLIARLGSVTSYVLPS
jgi:hypothetical protein